MIYSVCAERRADCLEKKTGAETELIGAAARRGQRKKRVDAGRKRNSAAAATAVNARPDGMPPEVEFIKEPGYMYDLLSMFVLYFNKEYFLSNMINYDKASADQEHYKSIIKEIEPVSNDLRIFFLMNANARTFMIHNYFDMLDKTFLTTYNLKEVQDSLRDCDSVKSKILEFYLPKLSKTKREECKNDLAELSRQMKIADLNPEIKNGLYSFFIEPEAILQKLAYELISKDFILKKKRESHTLLAEQLQESFNTKEVVEKVSQYQSQNVSIDITHYSKLYISFSMISKNAIKYYYFSDTVILLLGTDCLSYLDYLSARETAPDLETFGNALSDKYRVGILNLAAKNKEVSIKDIESELGNGGANVYYHLSLMLKANLLRARNQGRAVIYRLNTPYFNSVRDLLLRYAEPENEDSTS
jgi:hypothetical protein